MINAHRWSGKQPDRGIEREAASGGTAQVSDQAGADWRASAGHYAAADVVVSSESGRQNPGEKALQKVRKSTHAYVAFNI